MPRPEVELPSFMFLANLDAQDELWPLERMPALAPQAELGVIYRHSGPWTELCDTRGEARGVDRDEALAYLTTWCRVRDGDAETVRRELVPATRSSSLVIAGWARHEIVDALVLDRLDARAALGWLREQHVTDPQASEALLVGYIVQGREVDARYLATQLMTAGAMTTADCRTLYRLRALLHDPLIRDAIEERSVSDSTCFRIARLLDDQDRVKHCPLVTARWSDAGCTRLGCQQIEAQLARCGQVSITPRMRIGALHALWPSVEYDPVVWIEYARFGLDALGDPSGDALVLAALENAALLIPCRDHAQVSGFARELAAHSPHLASRVAYLTSFSRESCERRYSPTLDRPKP